jgi:hypothetical protein
VVVALESRPQGLEAVWHEAIGMVALALVCAGVLALMNGARRDSRPGPLGGAVRGGGEGSAPLWSRHWPAALVATFALGALLPLLLPQANAQAATTYHVEWPQQWDGRALRPLATSAVEQRFAARFPGAIGRFSDGERVLVLRRVTQPTRMLHPAADCFRGLGHRIEHTRLEHDARQRLWRCFESTAPDGERLRVCERIEAPDGSAFIDPSSWFWAASLGQSSGPWQAVTIVESL